MLEREGIANPWDEFPPCCSKNFLRARSKLIVSEGSAVIAWSNDTTKEVSQNIKRKHDESCQGSGTTWIRENDILSECLGPEHPGRVRGVSSTMSWKYGFPEYASMYKKRRRNVFDAIKA